MSSLLLNRRPTNCRLAYNANLHQDSNWSHCLADRGRGRDDKDSEREAERERWRPRRGAETGVQHPRARGRQDARVLRHTQGGHVARRNQPSSSAKVVHHTMNQKRTQTKNQISVVARV